jgi:preprotein translocase subunit SecB
MSTCDRSVVFSGNDAKERSDLVTRGVSLVDLRVRRVHADLHQLSPALDLEVWPKVEPSMTLLEDYVVFDVTYEVLAQDNNRKPAVTLTTTLTLIFELVDTFKTEDLEAFGSIGVLTIAHPYVREMFHSLTGRMGIPPLLLEVAPPEPSSISH